MRSPVTLRDLMIQPVRNGYVGQDHQIDPAMLPPTAAEVYPGIQIGEVYVPSLDGPIRCQSYKRADATGQQRMLLYIQGGGFTVGQSEDTASITSRIAWEHNLLVVSINYRLAPEWPFPYGLNDCLNVLAWLRGQARRLAVMRRGSPSRAIQPAGTSPLLFPLPPEAALLLCPITDLFFEKYPSFQKLAPRGIVYDTAFMGYIRGAYAVSYDNWSHPHVSPINGELAGFPPTLMVSGTADPLVDDKRAFVAKLEAAGN
jgi:acetyl esterase